MPYPTARTSVERVPVNARAPSASLPASRRRPGVGAIASRAFHAQMERIAARKISPDLHRDLWTDACFRLAAHSGDARLRRLPRLIVVVEVPRLRSPDDLRRRPR